MYAQSIFKLQTVIETTVDDFYLHFMILRHGMVPVKTCRYNQNVSHTFLSLLDKAGQRSLLVVVAIWGLKIVKSVLYDDGSCNGVDSSLSLIEGLGVGSGLERYVTTCVSSQTYKDLGICSVLSQDTADCITRPDSSPCFQAERPWNIASRPFSRTYSLASDPSKYNGWPDVTKVRIYIIALKKPSYVLHCMVNWLSLFNFSPWTRPFTSLCSPCCLPTTSGGGITQRCYRQDRGLFPWLETC